MSETTSRNKLKSRQIESDPLSLIMNGAHKGLTVKVNATNPNYQLDVAATTLYVKDIKLESLSFTADITANLDTGSEASDTWYYLWVFAQNSDTYTYKFSTSSTSPTYPAGYTKGVPITAVRNNASSNFEGLLQDGKHWFYTTTKTVLNSGAAGSPTTVDLATYVPLLTRTLKMSGYINTNVSCSGYVYGSVNGTYIQETFTNCFGGSYGSDNFNIVTDTRAIQYYTNPGPPNNVYLFLHGFEFPLGQTLV